MNPFVRDQIEALRFAGDNHSKAQATILEVLCEHTDQLGEIKAQVTKTNWRVTALESKSATVIGCPGKCNTLAIELEEEIARAKAQEARLIKLEEPVRVRGAIWHGVVSSFTGMSAVLAVVFGFLYIPGVSEHLFKNRDVDIAKIVQEQIALSKQK